MLRDAGRCRMWLMAAGLFSCALVSVPTAAQNRPLRTPDAELVPPGTVRIQAGFDFLQEAVFPLAGLTGDLTSLGAISIRTGLGHLVELQLEGVVQHFLSVKSQVVAIVTPAFTGRNSTRDAGDFSAFTKVRLFGETERRPGLAFRFGLQMPNSNQRRGIGTNTTNVFAELILQKHFGRFNLFGSIGLGILQAPAAQFSQNDVLLYGLGFDYPLHWTDRFGVRLVGEVAGRHSTRSLSPQLVGTESRSQARLGFQVLAGGFIWDVAGIAGLQRHDPDTGVTFGIRKDIRLFEYPPKVK